MLDSIFHMALKSVCDKLKFYPGIYMLAEQARGTWFNPH